jgi:acyl-CoA synthetase (NDP forming)
MTRTCCSGVTGGMAETPAALARDLTPLFAPEVVAVVGASDDPRKWGHFYAKSVLRGGERRTIYLVNARGGTVLGHETYASLSELPEVPDLALLIVPAGRFEDVVGEALELGVPALVAITAGLGELGPEGHKAERELVARVRAAGSMLVGPNCLGVLDMGSGLDASGFVDPPPGTVAFFSQSGSLGCDLAIRAHGSTYGFSRFVSLGNQADVTAAELIDDAIGDDGTEVIALYVEDVVGGRQLIEAALRARDAGKPVVMLAGGLTAAGARAALSHTGSLAADSAVLEAASQAAGIYLARSTAELSDLLQSLVAGKRMTGRRTAIISEAGGCCTVTADLASSYGLELQPFSLEVQFDLRGIISERVAPGNPLDLGGDEREALARSAKTLLEASDVDGLLIVGLLGFYSSHGIKGAPANAEEDALDEIRAAGRLVAIAGQSSKPMVVSTVAPASRAADVLRGGGIYVHGDFEPPLRLLERLAQHAGTSSHYLPLPEASVPVEVSGVGYWDARRVLDEAGVPFTVARPVRSVQQAAAAASSIGYPVVLKATTVLHKSDTGGVALNIHDEASLRREFDAMHERFGDTEYSVEQSAEVRDGVELIIGCRQDPRFGPVAVVGIGGVFVEVFKDVAVALAPIDAAQAAEMLESLAGADLLRGARGRPRLDLEAAAAAAATLSRVAAAHPEIEEIEVNPLLMLPEGAIALDARIVIERVRGGDRKC